MILILSILLRLIKVYTYLLIAYALMSWFPGAYDSKIGRLISGIVEPILKPLEHLIYNLPVLTSLFLSSLLV